MEKFYRRLSEILALILYGYLRTFATNGNKDVNVMYILYIYIFLETLIIRFGCLYK